jgi:hypothetical protein
MTEFERLVETRHCEELDPTRKGFGMKSLEGVHGMVVSVVGSS